MKNYLEWFGSLPFSLALRMTLVSLAKDKLRIPAVFSFAQWGDDLMIRYVAVELMGLTEPGHYVDVGCNAPVHYSNTFGLYLRGWRGINIDANSDMIRECIRVRRDDESICAAVSDSEREATFYKSKDTHLVATIDENRLAEWKKIWRYDDNDREIVMTKTLTTILDERWQDGSSIDVLTIDVEGQDFQVLKGLNFNKYRPKLIAIEIMHHPTDTIEEVLKSDLYFYLKSKDYQLKLLAFPNAYFVDKSFTAGAGDATESAIGKA